MELEQNIWWYVPHCGLCTKSFMVAHGQGFHFQDVYHCFYSVTSFYAGFRKSMFCCVMGCILTEGMCLPHEYRVNGFTFLVSRQSLGLFSRASVNSLRNSCVQKAVLSPKWTALFKFRNLLRIACSEGGSVFASWCF